MKKTQRLALFMVLILLIEIVTPWNTGYGSSSSTEVLPKEKVYAEWMPHTYELNRSGSAILRMSTVDYNTGLFTREDVVLDFIDTSKNYTFSKVWGLNTKRPHILYTVFESGAIEKIISYDTQKNSVVILTDRSSSSGKISNVYPDLGMYVVKKSTEEYLVYSLSTNKLLHKAKQEPREYDDPFTTNILNQNYFDPEPTWGALIVEPRKLRDPKTLDYKPYPGDFPYEIKPDGSITKLRSYKKNPKDDFVYKKKLSNSVIFKQSKAKDIIKHELIINGKSRTLHENYLKRSNHSYAYAQISPNNKYIVLNIEYYENKRYVKGKDEYLIFDAKTGRMIKRIPLNIVGSPTLMDFKINWKEGTDHIIQLRLSPSRHQIIDSDISTPWSYGKVVLYGEGNYSFSLDDYLTTNDPIPVSFNKEYMKYSGQGTFRTADKKIFTPVNEFMTLLGGTLVNTNGKTTITYQNKTLTLDGKKQIVWKNRIYYPINDIVHAFGLKIRNIKNSQAADDWRELQIY